MKITQRFVNIGSTDTLAFGDGVELGFARRVELPAIEAGAILENETKRKTPIFPYKSSYATHNITRSCLELIGFSQSYENFSPITKPAIAQFTSIVVVRSTDSIEVCE